ncbi:MAG: COX15/CtaA family protein, partial [Deltaproteobacteria bacterium]|nr:COX15/CtaA family protein [Deltaproteobacteria bacterium]
GGAALWGFAALLGLQIVYGAFMAGKRAGKIFATFPDMNGSFLPAGWRSGGGVVDDVLYNPIAIHAIHRTLAWAVALAAVVLATQALRRAQTAAQRRVAQVFAALVGVQVALGAATVMSSVAIPWAVAHQGVALLLLSATTALGFVACSPARST